MLLGALDLHDFQRPPLRSYKIKVRDKSNLLSDHLLLFQENCRERVGRIKWSETIILFEIHVGGQR